MESLVVNLSINSGQMVSAENLVLQKPLSNREGEKKTNSTTLKLALPTSEDSGLGTLVKFVADPVVWWELSRSWLGHTGRRALFRSQPLSTLVE